MKCKGLGGDLASIGTVTELQLVKKLLEGRIQHVTGLKDLQLWLIFVGLNDRVTEGDFVWIDGTQTNEAKWENGEPNGFTAENCGAISYLTANLVDISCNEQLTSICKLK